MTSGSKTYNVKLDRLLPGSLKWLTVLLGAAHTWVAIRQHSMNEDGIAYLDIGDAYMRGDWATAINSVWSPMYSWILGPVIHIVEPSIYWEFGVVQIVNFVIFIAALIAFQFFWRQVVEYHTMRSVEAQASELPHWMIWSLGYLLFLFSSLNLIQMWAVTPDMLMSIAVYLAAGLLIRSRLAGWSWARAAMFGGLLGLGYLAKSVMFPLSFAFLAVGLFSGSSPRHSASRMALALACFAIVAAPFVALISVKKQAFTFGDAGKITYVRYINGLPYPHWQGGPSGMGSPVHPTRLILESPAVYEFATPVGGTYPVSTDPSYWYEGAIAHVEIAKQAAYALYSIVYYVDLLLRQQGAMLFGILLLYTVGHLPGSRVSDILRGWGLSLFALAAFGLYGLVHVTGRYIGAFLVLFWADMVANVLPHAQEWTDRVVRATGAMMIILLLGSIGAFNLQGVLRVTGESSPHRSSYNQPKAPAWQGEIALSLQKLGIERGCQVAVIGDGFTSFWARLARVRIVAELPESETEEFWKADEVTHARVLGALAASNARAVVARDVPLHGNTDGWHRVGDSDTFVRTLD